MSSAVFTTPSPGTTINSSSSPNAAGENFHRGASYFFGFLITFVVLLFIFVGCGVISRRRFSQRQRARSEWDMQPWTEITEFGVGYVPPVLFEKTFASAQAQLTWRDMMPLAALVCPLKTSGPEHVAPTSSLQPSLNQAPFSPAITGQRGIDLLTVSRTLSASRRRSESLSRINSGNSGLVRITSPTPYHRNPNVIMAQREAEELGQNQERDFTPQSHRWRSIFNPAAWLMRRRRRNDDLNGIDNEKKHNSKSREQKDLVMQVALLVRMPTQTSSVETGGEQSLPTHEIGVASVPWTDDLRQYSQRTP